MKNWTTGHSSNLDMSRRIAFYFDMRNKHMGPHTRLEENRHLPLSRRSVLQKTCMFMNMHGLVQCTLFCTVRMRNAIQRNYLNEVLCLRLTTYTWKCFGKIKERLYMGLCIYAPCFGIALGAKVSVKRFICYQVQIKVRLLIGHRLRSIMDLIGYSKWKPTEIVAFRPTSPSFVSPAP